MVANLELHPEIHNEFHFAEGTEVTSSCCFACWRSKPKAKKTDRVTVIKSDERTHLSKTKKTVKFTVKNDERPQLANREPFENIKLQSDSIEEEGSEITQKKLETLFNALYEISKGNSDSTDNSLVC